MHLGKCFHRASDMYRFLSSVNKKTDADRNYSDWLNLICSFRTPYAHLFNSLTAGNSIFFAFDYLSIDEVTLVFHSVTPKELSHTMHHSVYKDPVILASIIRMGTSCIVVISFRGNSDYIDHYN